MRHKARSGLNGLDGRNGCGQLCHVGPMKRRIFRGAVALGIAYVSIVLVVQILPYSQSHFRQIEAVKLRMFVEEWELMGRPADYLRTNKSGRKVFLFDKEVSVGGTNVHGFMRLESETLTTGGYLIATTNSLVFWCDANGCKPIK